MNTPDPMETPPVTPEAISDLRRERATRREAARLQARAVERGELLPVTMLVPRQWVLRPYAPDDDRTDP